MTIIEENMELNQLINNGFIEKKYYGDSHTYLFTLKDNHIFCDGNPVGFHANTIDKRVNSLSRDARRAYFIEEILNSVGINVNNIETEYNLITSSDSYIVFCKNEIDKCTFIEFCNNEFHDIGIYLNMVKLDYNNSNLVFDRISFKDLRYFHADSKISKFTINKINKSWSNKNLSHNDLYDVIAEDAVMPKNECAWIGMYEYGNYVCDLDINKLDKNICEIDNSNDKVKVYYL